jgi:transposase
VPVRPPPQLPQEVRGLFTARKLVQSKLYDIEMSLRRHSARFRAQGGADDLAQLCGAHRSSGLQRSEPGNDSRSTAFDACKALRAFKNLAKNVRQIGRAVARVRLLMPTYVSAIEVSVSADGVRDDL